MLLNGVLLAEAVGPLWHRWLGFLSLCRFWLLRRLLLLLGLQVPGLDGRVILCFRILASVRLLGRTLHVLHPPLALLDVLFLTRRDLRREPDWFLGRLGRWCRLGLLEGLRGRVSTRLGEQSSFEVAHRVRLRLLLDGTRVAVLRLTWL